MADFLAALDSDEEEEEEVPQAPAAAAGDGGDDDDGEAAPAPAAEDVPDEIMEMFSSDKKKKRKKKPRQTRPDAEDGDAAPGPIEEGGGASASLPQVSAQEGRPGADAPQYSYNELLQRVQHMLMEKNPELQNKRRQAMKQPELVRVGTKKTLWANFQEICATMHRSHEHVFQFMLAELGTEGSIDGSQRLVIRGKFAPKYIESLLRKYIVEYVTCQMCRSPNTTLTRDSVSRLYFVNCNDCGSSRSVAAIKTGYHAQTRADRRAARK
eukprot:CAMPEP_0198424870 /NCGR_PEP_ID=MMETSP1452-20131203/4168_1 /TAXON_ID=1181717 /ORGANISM="Synchroma pusillum, Strain CCMP3072" /LENGTH=267 /DNA_ID=CAMNT_0044145223 /DNA_START=71 /DNA_END=874 /DNA_ORIENTATION=+